MSSTGSGLRVIFRSVGFTILRHLVIVGSRRGYVRVANIIQYSATDVEQGGRLSVHRSPDISTQVPMAMESPKFGLGTMAHILDVRPSV